MSSQSARFGMLDAGQVDWKLVVIPADHPEAANISDAKDAEREFPGELEAIREWFRDYKTLKNVNGTLEPSGDPPSEFDSTRRVWMATNSPVS